MDPNENDIGRWVDERLAGLEPAAGWRPNAQRALAQLRDRRRALQRRRIWIWGSSAVGAAACLAVLALVSPQACASPLGCTDGLLHRVLPKPAPAVTSPTVEKNFRLSGNTKAPIVCEIYTDYACPACARFYRDTVPLLVSEYVKPGKVQLLHRDFPLPQHAYSRVAARWANAAGRFGFYDAAVNRIFETQALWSGNGDVGAQLASVLPPDVLEKARTMVGSDATLDESVDADFAMGTADQLRATPMLVIVFQGKRQAMPGTPSFALLKSYLDQLGK